MASTGQQPATVVHHDSPVKHVHHGRTLAAWTGSAIALLAVIVGGIAVVVQYWPMFWFAVALAAVALIATVVLQRMGYGAS